MAEVRDQELVDRFETLYRRFYADEIAELARAYPRERKSLEIDWEDLFRFDPDFADDVLSYPDRFRDAAEEALRLYDLPVDVSLAQAHVRFTNLGEVTEIREIRSDHINTLVSVRGIVRKATNVRPKIQEATFVCQRCGAETVVPQTDAGFQDPYQCESCERQGPFQLEAEQSTFVDAQKLRIQESPEGLGGGETPQAVDMNVEDDLTGEVTPGDHVVAIGILRLDQGKEQSDSPIFDVYLEGVSIDVEDEEFEEMDITQDDKREIIELSETEDLYEQIVASIAPAIYGYEQAKLAMALQLFSGVTKHLPDGSRIRGDLHMLLIGDPGTGKSQLLQYIRNIAPRSVYTSGKGSSSAGLTAAAVRDDFGDGQQWTLEAGALVLADQGIAAVDELDKMRCVTGDTLVSLGDGRIDRIGEIAREAATEGSIEPLENGRTIRDVGNLTVKTMAGDGSIEERPVTAIHEFDAPGELCEVTLESGESVTTTPDHPFFVFEEGDREERPASDLSTGDWVFVPEPSPQRVGDGGVEATRSVSNFQKTDDSSSAALGAILGYLSGDGNIYYNRDGGSYGIRFTNSEEELLADFERAAERVFESSPVRHPSEQRSDDVETVRVHGKGVADAVLEAGMNLQIYDEKAFPTGVTEGGRRQKAAFVRALADSEGTVDTASGNVKIFSASKELLNGTKEVLREFGISSQIQRRRFDDKRDLYVLAITDADSIRNFRSHIGFTLSRKQQSLESIAERVDGSRTILDVIPDIGAQLRRTRSGLRLHQSECGTTAYGDFERGTANTSLHRANAILRAFEDRKGEAGSDLKQLDKDVTWSELEDICDRYHVSQSDLAGEIGRSQQSISELWGENQTLKQPVRAALQSILESVSTTNLEWFTSLVRGDVKWRRVKSVNRTHPNGNGDDHIPQLQDRLARELGCSTANAERTARTLLEQPLSISDVEDVATAIEELGISQYKIAERVGVDQSSISRWVTGAVESNELPSLISATKQIISEKRQLIEEQLDEIEERRETKVYDLTVDGTHNFVANGMVVHNSEDRSAMHEALEQQSYHPNSEILLADGRRKEIGDLVNERMAAASDEIVDGMDCEILPVDDLRVHSVDMDTNDVSKVPVDRVSRHEAPDEFVRVTFSNGRSVLVTPEHPMFVAGEGDTVDARDIVPGTFVPAPRKLPNSSAPVSLEDEPQVGKEKDIDLPDSMSHDLAEILGFLVAEGHSYAGSSHEIGFSNQDDRLLNRMDSLFRSVFGMESTDTTNSAGTVTQRWVSTKLYRWFEQNFPKLMETAREKRIPDPILGGSEEEIRRFLVGAFAGDGGVESEAMAFSTASPKLAEDYADALAKIGVASRIHHDSAQDSWKTYVMGDSTKRFVDTVVEPADERFEKAQAFVERSLETKRHHDVLPTSAARELRSLKRLLGVGLTGKFRPNLDRGYGVQIETVREELEALRARARSVRESLEGADSLAAVRSTIRWSARALAERLDGATTSEIHYAEDGGYDAEHRESLHSHARTAVRNALSEFETRADELEAQTDLRYYRVTDVETVPNEGEYETEWVYDVTVEPTNTFVSQGVVLHNSISISKAGINATLKARCSLLGAANPKYGRFDQYESIGEQIDLEPALISRFDLIFTVTDQPDAERDAELADHILQTNYAGELNTHRSNVTTSNVTDEEVDGATQEVEPAIDAEFLRKYVAYARRNTFPTMTPAARSTIEDFYVNLRSKGEDEDAPVPVTARKLEALVRLAEASARMRLSDTVEEHDAERVIEIVRTSMQAVGMDPETDQYDADVIETGTSKSQRDRIKNIKHLIEEIEDDFDEGAPVDEVLARAEEVGMERSKAEHEIEKLKQRGEVYEPSTEHLRTT